MLCAAPFRGQFYIRSALERLKLNVKSNGSKINISRGVCGGSAMKAIEDYLLDNLPAFKSKIIILHAAAEKYKQLDKLPATQSKKRKREADKKLDTPTNRDFLGAINLYQNSLYLRHSLPESIPQTKPADISRLVATPKIVEQGGLHQIACFLNFFSLQETVSFLELIEKHITIKTAFSISCSGHRIGLGFDGNKREWTFMDPNNFFPYPIAKSELAKKIFAAFTFNREKFIHADLNIRWFTLGSQKEITLQQALNLQHDPEFIQLLHITPEKAKLTVKNEDLLATAAAAGNCAVIEKLLAHTTDTLLLKRAFFYAAYESQIEVIKVLIQHSPSLVTSTRFGTTALHIAAKKDYADLAHFLLSRGADPFLEDADKLTAVTTAIKKGSQRTLELLKNNGIDLTRRDSTGNTPFAFASEHNPSLTWLLTTNENNKRCTLFGSTASRPKKFRKLNTPPADVPVKTPLIPIALK